MASVQTTTHIEKYFVVTFSVVGRVRSPLTVFACVCIAFFLDRLCACVHHRFAHRLVLSLSLCLLAFLEFGVSIRSFYFFSLLHRMCARIFYCASPFCAKSRLNRTKRKRERRCSVRQVEMTVAIFFSLLRFV